MHQNNERLFLVNTKLLTNCSPYFIVLKVINNLDTQRSFNTMVNLENLKLKKKILAVPKLFAHLLKLTKIFTKNAKNSTSVYNNHIFLSCERLLLSP